MKRPIPIAIGFLTPLLIAQEWQRGPAGGPAARQEWFYSQRAYPLDSIPAGARNDAIHELERINRTARQQRRGPLTAAAGPNANAAAAMDSATWTLIGPKPTSSGLTSVTSGRVNAIAVDPRNNNVVYIGAAEGGIWKTIDGGLNWTPLTDNQASLATGAIAIDPRNPDTVYVGTGEENFNGDGYYGAGILKSTDGGVTWTNIVGPFLRDRIGTIAVSPSISGLVLCAAQSGLWRSSDGGATWIRTQTGTATSLIFDPRDGNSVFAALGSTGGSTLNGVYHSIDGGVTWLKLDLSSPAITNMGRIQLAMAPSQPSTMYAQVQNSSSAAFGTLLGIWKTTDAGITWNKLNIPNTSSWGNQLWYDTAIAVSPSDPNVVYSGATPIFRSLDGGTTWGTTSQLGPNLVLNHVDQHMFAFTSDGSKLYIANDGGMYYTTDITASASALNWNTLNNTLAITQFYPGMSIDPENAASAIGGTQDNGTQRYSGSLNWDSVTCGDGGFTAIDPSATLLGYGACQDIAIQRTLTLSGTPSWIPATYGIDQTDRTQFISPFVIDPSNPQTLYFGTFRLWQSQDSGGKWKPVSPDLTGGFGTLKAIAVAPSDSNTVYVGSNDAFVKVTHNIQDGINAVWSDRTGGLPIRSVTHIAVDPVDAGVAYVTFSGFALTGFPGHVFKTTNGGATWIDISGNLPDLPVNDLVLDPDLPLTLYIGTDAGVMVTTDGGVTWSSLGQGLPNVVVTSLVLQRKSRLLRAATHGRSVWDIVVPLGAGSSQQPLITSLTPSTINAGSPEVTINVTGSGFGSTTTIRWNGQNRPTTFVDGTHLTVKIPASDLALSGRAAVTAFKASNGGGSSNAIGFNIGPAPQASSNGFVSLVYTLGGSALGFRTLASLYGSNLASQVAIADLSGTWPFTLGGVTMTINANIVPLYYVSPDVIVFQVPFFSGSGSLRVPLVLTVGTQSITMNVTIQPYSPAIVTTNIGGSGQAKSVVALTGQIAAPVGAFPNSRPVHVGEYLSIYATGLGDVTNRPGLGSPSPSNPLARSLVNPAVTIGNVPVTDIQFSGLAPTTVGLFVVNARIPPGVPLGDAIPITLSIGGLTSNTGTIAIDAAP